MTRVLVAAADLITRAGLESILRASPDLAVVGISSDVATLATLIEDAAPDVVLMQLDLHDDAISEKLLVIGALVGVAIVVLTDDLHGDWTTEALRLGVRSRLAGCANASGFAPLTLSLLPRSATAEELLPTVIAAAAGLVVIHPDVLDSLLLLPSNVRALPTSPTQALTAREVEVLGMLAEGLGNKAIARRLNISEHTVKFHVSSIFTKLNASSRTEAVMLGARQGLILL